MTTFPVALKRLCAAVLSAFLTGAGLQAQSSAGVTLEIKADRITARVSPLLYGLMTEEINYSYDGGLYGELVRNRNFKEAAKESVHWQLIQERGRAGSNTRESSQPPTIAMPA